MKNQEKIFVVTGGTGNLGYEIIEKLLKNKYDVVASVRDLEIAGKIFEKELKIGLLNLVKIEDILKIKDSEEIKKIIKNKALYVIHSAADTNLSIKNKNDKKGEKLWQTNVDGTMEMLKFADENNAVHFNYISTYFKEWSKKYKDGEWTNLYEESKDLAENLVRESDLNYSIMRPSIIIGNSNTGSLQNCSTMCQFLGLLNKIFKKKDKDFQTILMDPESENSILNLVYSDWVAEKIINTSLENNTGEYNLSNNNSPKYSETLETSSKILWALNNSEKLNQLFQKDYRFGLLAFLYGQLKSPIKIIYDENTELNKIESKNNSLITKLTSAFSPYTKIEDFSKIPSDFYHNKVGLFSLLKQIKEYQNHWK